MAATLTAPTFTPATPAQIRFMSALASERGLTVTETALTSTTGATKEFAEISKREASQMIEFLKSLPRAPKAAPATAVEIEDGMYRLDGTIYKVQHAVHGSGRQYAKRLMVECWADSPEDASIGYTVEFVHAPGVVRKLRPEHRMTLAEAKEFGALYGTCCQCGRTLTDENSIAAGIGPVCASKF